jgi:hypothetical protein
MAKLGRPKTVKAPTVQYDVKLPDGACVVERSHEMEMLMNTRNKWIPYAQKVYMLEGTQALQLELGDLKDMPNSKVRINSMKSGIKSAWKQLGHKSAELRIGIHNGKLFIWANKRS